MTDSPKRSWQAQTRRVFILLAGCTILLIGALLLVLPGPGILIILGGLALLAVEFEWANGALEKFSSKLRRGESKESKHEDE